ncbi:hypothetical protein [Flavobacterium commune]|uniref:Uncharacterized protein n=1 Tax=Flavobacterium commune TaxID=1306519 RepID=A0A1D9PAW1_9FLAO|nr:hypothetical protein [Flavobacterium commune]AOZ99718.1 hypothetical protein BIW12_09860 [Flavobacterium commune]
MRKNFFTVFVLINFCCGFAQKHNTINKNGLTINGIIFKINSGNNDVPLILKTFGQPDSIEDYFFEIDNVMGKKYTYNNGLILYVTNNSLESFEITGKSYLFSPKNIKVGDTISSLETKFPNSYKSRSNLVLKLNYLNWDAGFLIEYNASGIVRKISFYKP